MSMARFRETLTRLASRFALPDPKLTPGAINPDVTTDTIKQTICMPGWALSYRQVSSWTKAKVYLRYRTVPLGHVIDHLVPIECGGANVIENLWPQTIAASNAKNMIENECHHGICQGEKELARVQNAFMIDWRTAALV